MTELASDPSGRSVTATIKFGGGFDDAWLVFRGLEDEVYADIVKAFGLTFDDVAGKDLSDLVFDVSQQAKAMGAVAKEFSGTRSGGRSTRGAAKPASKPEPTKDEIVKALIEAVAAEDDSRAAKDKAIKELQQIWKDHNPLNEENEALWRAKGKSLKA